MLKRMMLDSRRYWPALLPLLLVACAAKQGNAPMTAADATVCEDPRPQICTADYRPVCASLKDASRKTYANGCSACGDPQVVSWVDNACPE